MKSLITEFVSSKSPAKPKPKKKKEAESVVNGQQPLLTAPGMSFVPYSINVGKFSSGEIVWCSFWPHRW